MAEDFEKIDFTDSGESQRYISLDQARVVAIKHVRDNPGFYGAKYSGISLVWEVQSQEETEDFYEIRLSFRPSGKYSGDPGIEHLTINKVNGNVEIRQVLDEPWFDDSPSTSSNPIPEPSPGKNPMGSPERLTLRNSAQDEWPLPTDARLQPSSPSSITAAGRIAFASKREGKFQLSLINADGSGETRLSGRTILSERQFNDRNPAWSPDGTHIAFMSDTDGRGLIYVMDADGSRRKRLTRKAAYSLFPSWSPDGANIAFTSDRNAGFQIYVMKANGTKLKQLTNLSGNKDVPTWSPDGTRIAFSNRQDGNSMIHVVNADGSNQRPLSGIPAHDSAPSWSPVGENIVFSSNQDGNSQLYVMNSDGTEKQRLTNNPANDWDPSWSPDGANITFLSDRNGTYQIYVMNADGSGQTQLTRGSDSHDRPAWSPYTLADRGPIG